MRRSSLLVLAGGAALSTVLPAAAADALLPIRVGTLPIDPTAQPFYAASEGFFKAAGLDATVTVANNGSSLVAATASGAIDVIASSPAPLILAHRRGIPLKMIEPAAIYTGPTPNAAMMVLSSSPLRSGADFTGKTIGVAGLNDLTQYSVQAWIDKGGGNSASVRFIEIPYAEMVVALQQNRIDGAGIIEPFITGAKKVARIVGNLNDAIGHRYVLAGWCADGGWLERNTETARRFIRAMQLTATWANAHHSDSAAILTRYTKITPEVAAVMARAHYDDSGRLDPSTLQPVIDALVKYARLQPFPPSDVTWTPGNTAGMFQNLMQQLDSGQVDHSQVERGTADHVNSMGDDELQGHLQTAANNAQQSGQGGFAQQIMGLLSNNSGNPQGLRGGVVSLITQNPAILERFAPGFTQGILQRFL